MATMNSETQYSRRLDGFRGVDLTSGDSQVSTQRFAYLKNMYRDYESEQGDAVETIPGFRLLKTWAGKRINGIYEYKPAGGELLVVVHAGTFLYVFKHGDRDLIAEGLPPDSLAVGDTFVIDVPYYDTCPLDSTLSMSANLRLVRTETDNECGMVSAYTVECMSEGAAWWKLRDPADYETINEGALTIYPALPSYVTQYGGLNDAKSTAFMHSNKFWILDGVDYWCLYDGELKKTAEVAYLPVTHINGVQYEQRNMINTRTINRDTQVAEGTLPDMYSEQGFKDGWESDVVTGTAGKNSYRGNTDIKYAYVTVTGDGAFENCTGLKEVTTDDNSVTGFAGVFRNCTSLERVNFRAVNFANKGGNLSETFEGCINLKIIAVNAFSVLGHKDTVEGEEVYYSALDGIPTLETVYTRVRELDEDFTSWPPGEQDEWNDWDANALPYIPDGVTVVYSGYTPSDYAAPTRKVVCYDPADSIETVLVDNEEYEDYQTVWRVIDGVKYVDSIFAGEEWSDSEVDIYINCKPSEFKTVSGHLNFKESNDTYSGTSIDAITKCSVSAVYDGRVFLTGNPELPNTVFYAQRDLTGYANPAYFGVLNYINDGTGSSPNRAMLATSGLLMVLKGDTLQDGSIYYHSGADTQDNIIPRVYPSTQGVAGLGCLGGACNFLDDPVFLSRRGMEAVGKQQVNLERTLTHRSYRVDRLLVAEDLAAASVVEWRGYLCVFCPSGRVYMADSRQMSEHPTGAIQYEWYCLEDIGIYENQEQMYAMATGQVRAYNSQGGGVWLHESDCYVEVGGERRSLNTGGKTSGYVPFGEVYSSYIYTAQYGIGILYEDKDGTVPINAYVAEYNGDVFLVEPTDRHSGGVFSPAITAHAMTVDDVLYFGTAGGDICCFNNDKRGVAYDGEPIDSDKIHRHWYTFNNRTIHSSLSTAYEDAGYPDLSKKTVKKSMVIQTKVFDNSMFDIYVRTDRTDDWNMLATISNSAVQFYGADYGNAPMQVSNEGISTVREKEKKWSRKQYFMESAYHRSPFGLYHIGYRFNITGRIKS